MKKLIFLAVLIKGLFAYYLIVNTQDDANKLKQIGIDCKFNHYEQYYVCAESNDIDQLKRVKRYINLNYNISTYIVQSNSEKMAQKNKPAKIIKSKTNVKKTSNATKEITSYSTNPPVKSGYCIQVAASKSKNAMLKLFDKYASYPYSRVEKIGSYYVLRIGEDDYKNIKNLKRRVDRGFIRKCDYKPERIVKSKKKIINPSFTPKKQISNIERMYNELNAGNLNEAEKLAENLKDTKYQKDAYNVLGIIALKKKNYFNACGYLKKSDNYKLKNTACYLYNLKKGYSLLNTNPSASYGYFKTAKRYKNTEDVTEALGYAYLNMKNYKKAEKIFQKLYRKHPDKLSVIKGYVIALYNLKDYKKLNELKYKIPIAYYPAVEEYYLYVDLNEANDLIEKNELKKAEKKLLAIYEKHPRNVNVKLSLAGLYLKKNELEKAEELYNEVLKNNPENIYALEGLRAVELKKGNLQKALIYSKKLEKLGISVDDTNVKYIVDLKNLQKYINGKNCEKAAALIEKLQNYDKADKYMLIGDYYKNCENNATAAFEFYKKGYRKSSDFGIKLKYLYALLNLNKLNDIKEVLAGIDEKKLTPIDKIKLKQFYVDYYTKLAGNSFKDEQYEKALKLCEKSSSYGKSPGCYEISGWSCFKLKNYKCAVKNFEKAPQNENNKYALALSYMNLGYKTKAKKLLDEIADTKNEKLRYDVAKAYIALGELSSGEEALASVKDTNLSDNLADTYKLLEIKKSDYRSYLEAGVNFRYKTGTEGLDKLNDSLTYFKGGYYIDEKRFIYFKIGALSLFSGELSDYNQVGSGGTLVSKNWVTDYQGVAAKAGFSYNSDKIFKIDLGITPMSDDVDIDYTYTGKITAGIKKDNKKYQISLFRDSVKDSILSYVGNYDSYGKDSYGRVLENGMRFEYENVFDVNDSIIYLSALVSNLSGQNVKNNKKYELDALAMKYIGNNLLTYDYAGLYGMYEKYRYNENNFLYGNGGYFSPSSFILLALRYEGYQFLDKDKFGAKAYLSTGVLRFKENDTTTSLGFEFGGYAKYLADSNLALKGGFALRKSADYSDFYINFSLQYYFASKYRVTKSELNEGIKEMLKTW